MKVTGVQVFLTHNNAKMLAFAKVVFDHSFMVNDVKVIKGNGRTFVAMPSRQRSDGEYFDVCHPVVTELREEIENQVLAEYRRLLAMEERGEVVR